jgi:hypothetical protein
MHRIFDQDDLTLSSIYNQALVEWESSLDDERKSMAINLRCDHRVTAAREQQFRTYFTRHNHLKAALDDYARRHVRFTASPDFCESWCENVVVDTTSGDCCPDFDQDIELATVISLNGLATAIKDSYPNIVEPLPEWRSLLDSETQASDPVGDLTFNGDRFDHWLEENLAKKTQEQVESFLRNIFEVMNYRLTIEEKYYNPVWATTWERFQTYATEDAERWSDIVGVPRAFPTWQIVIRYPARIVRCLHRPSQLDGGYYPQHFPSPRAAKMSTGGLTMDLHQSNDRPLNEYIHKQIKLDIRYWVDAGRLIGKTRTTPDKLSEMRQKHYAKLIEEYDERSIAEWMPRPI